MARWEPGARERLQGAALELYAERGFEQTTAAEVAASVGLTERTFFRHFADKREVLFNGSAEFEQGFLDGVIGAAPGAGALDAVSTALDRAAAYFPDERRDYARLRQSIIVANPSLRERELLKMRSLSAGIAAALRTRGVGDPEATLAAESGVTVFNVAFERWIETGQTQSLAELQRQVMGSLRALARPT